MNDLDKLAIKYGADKWGKHHYTPVYYDLFKDKVKSVKKVLEIGVAEGASLFMWRDFFPNAIIYGAEINQERVDKLQGLDRIEVYKCDQSDTEDIEHLLSLTQADIDLVIDDGSHNPEDQTFSCDNIMWFLKKDAVYVIEDVSDPRIAQDIENQQIEGVGYDVEVVECGKRYDDRLIIVRHKNG